MTGDIEARAREADVDVVTTVAEGFPSQDILGYVEEESIDLVAMGTRGRTGLDRFLLGSTTERIVRESPAPVLSVRRRDHGVTDD